MAEKIKEQIAEINKDIAKLYDTVQTEYNLADIISLHLRNRQLTTGAVQLAISIENHTYKLIELWYKVNDQEIRNLIANRLKKLIAEGVSLTPKKIADLDIIFQNKINP